MTSPARFPFKPVGHATPALESRVNELRGRLRLLPPTLLAERTGADYIELEQSRGEFHLTLLSAPTTLTYPDFRANDNALPVFKQALLIYYFAHSDGTPPAGEWVSFADLPDGRVYSSAFQGYTGDLLAKTFLLNLDAFRSACQKADGVPVPFGDAAFRFRALPRVDLLLVYHLGDEDFPSTCKLLFDARTGHLTSCISRSALENASYARAYCALSSALLQEVYYLPAEACAVLGSSLAQKVLRVSQARIV